MNDVDYEFWLKKENWSELEARFLLTGLTPFYDHKLPFLSDNFFFDENEEEIEEIKERFEENVNSLVAAINYESIKEVSYLGDGILTQGGGWQAHAMDVLKITRYFNKTKLIKWAIDEGLDIPKELFSWYIKWQSHTTREVLTLAGEFFPTFKGLEDDNFIEQENSENIITAENERLKVENESLKKQCHDDLHPRERNTLLKIIAVMAKDGYNNDLSEPYGEISKIISTEAQLLGFSITAETIGDKLKLAKQFLDSN